MVIISLMLGCTVCGEGTQNVDGVCVPVGADDTGSDDTGTTGDDTGVDDTGDAVVGHATFSGSTVLPGDAIQIQGEHDDEYFGVNLEVEDVTGDGQVDLVVASTGYGGGIGRVSVFPGPITSDQVFSDAAQVVTGSGTRMRAGRRLAVVNGDLVIGQDDHEETADSVWIVAGSESGVLGDVGGALTPLEIGATSGWRFSQGGDVTGDGVEDLLVAAGTADYSYSGLFVLSGPAAGDPLLNADARITTTVGDVAELGDVDGDGVDDIAVGQHRAYDPDGEPVGAIRVFLGPLEGDLTDDDAA